MHRVADDHRRELAAGEHVLADRHGVGGEVLDDALVEALVAPAQQRDVGLLGELVDEPVVEQPAARRQRDDAPLRGAGRPGRRRSSARSAASMTSTRRTIPAPPPNGVSSTWPPLSGVCSRRSSVRSSWPAGERVGDVALRAKPVKPVGEQRDDVEPHRIAARLRRSGQLDPEEPGIDHDPARVDVDADAPRRRPSARAGRRPRAPRTTAARASPPRRRARGRPASRPCSPRGPRPSTRPRAAAARRRARRAGPPRAAPRRRRGRRSRAGAGSGGRRCPARRTISWTSSPIRTAPPSAEQHAARARDVKGAVEPVRAPDAAGVQQRHRPSAWPPASRRCRRTRGGLP